MSRSKNKKPKKPRQKGSSNNEGAADRQQRPAPAPRDNPRPRANDEESGGAARDAQRSDARNDGLVARWNKLRPITRRLLKAVGAAAGLLMAGAALYYQREGTLVAWRQEEAAARRDAPRMAFSTIKAASQMANGQPYKLTAFFQNLGEGIAVQADAIGQDFYLVGIAPTTKGRKREFDVPVSSHASIDVPPRGYLEVGQTVVLSFESMQLVADGLFRPRARFEVQWSDSEGNKYGPVEFCADMLLHPLMGPAEWTGAACD